VQDRWLMIERSRQYSVQAAVSHSMGDKFD
jgi:hypothetical protein